MRNSLLVPRSTCTNDTDAGCHKPTATPTLPIVLAVVIPIVIAIVVLIFLHRRHLRKLKEEDAKDPHKSLDFGMDPAFGPRGKKGKGPPGGPEMSTLDTEKELRRGKGMSMDIGSPYILPAGLQGSRESFHSMSRSMHDPDDPYRPVTFIKGDGSSIRSGSRTGGYRQDNGSVYTSSSGGTSSQHRMKDGLLSNAQRMSQSFPIRGESMSPENRHHPEIKFPEATATARSPLGPGTKSPPPPPPPPAPLQPQSHGAPAPDPQPQYTAFKPMSPPPPPPVPLAKALPPTEEQKVPAQLPRIQSQAAVVQSSSNTASFMSDSSYGDGFKVTPPSPPRQQPRIVEPQPTRGRSPEPRKPMNDPYENAGLGLSDLGYDPRRLSMSVRPLPPDDPTDNPEQRANRIRSFYKEYFDDSKPEPAGGHSYTDYYEDYGSEYLDGAIFDPDTGAFVVAQPAAPFAQPVTRRAMTPPPRAPPRFQSGGPRGGHLSNGSTASSGRFMPPPRGMSSMSGRLPQPRKPLPPPSTLASLPTPHMLKDDSMIFNATDFAPPVSFRERQLGRRPDSPLGTPRPYSPAVRPHTPLASAYDDLAVMPSPHMLRKSGTFTALDFAPPPRFRDPGSNASDAGSIRSNRSGMSAAGRFAVRNGANRVSKIPKGVVGTRDDIVNTLRPQMSMVAPA
ncbi:uncharacterized protein BDR25DRAFT_73431 [Lindgomyces ingoldianus]|uniref:Uncharacterized protein n=1 Tax=Lindgomyces ingoldianus TaxID=673940 RepID=A0ACB6QJB8_9PLEO|nr:uncharacterized protein BDR25DRAFT_73431 [Lindgomyces ingoldianus]KAF2467114.1 hypothetical protein BDR25DRAFT_73431 [Lindgomyces ingoldianus]